uniref:Uncharacterized protein n=1 Tax=Romanomermis culicivorax TaxID=13658 RepID=A0A915K1W6_ROMCU
MQSIANLENKQFPCIEFSNIRSNYWISTTNKLFKTSYTMPQKFQPVSYPPNVPELVPSLPTNETIRRLKLDDEVSSSRLISFVQRNVFDEDLWGFLLHFPQLH